MGRGPHVGKIEERKKLATASALLVQLNLVNATILSTLQKDHLVKDGIGLDFLDTFFRAFLVERRGNRAGFDPGVGMRGYMLEDCQTVSRRNICWAVPPRTTCEQHLEAAGGSPYSKAKGVRYT